MNSIYLSDAMMLNPLEDIPSEEIKTSTVSQSNIDLKNTTPETKSLNNSNTSKSNWVLILISSVLVIVCIGGLIWIINSYHKDKDKYYPH